MTLSKNTRKWLHGLGAAAIGGGATAITVMVVDPNTFNFQEGFLKLVEAAGVSGLVNSAFYLKKSPLPEDTDQTDENASQEIPK